MSAAEKWTKLDLAENSGSIGRHLQVIDGMKTEGVQVQPQLELVEAAQEYRKAFSAVGLGVGSFDLMTEGDIQSGGSEMAIGQYNSGTDQLSIATVPVMIGVAKSARRSVKEVTQATLEHEVRHQTSMTAEKAGVIRQIIIEHRGEKAYHNAQEAMASFKTTEGFDAYNSERTQAANDANYFGLSRTEYIRVVHEGDVETLQSKLEEKGSN